MRQMALRNRVNADGLCPPTLACVGSEGAGQGPFLGGPRPDQASVPAAADRGGAAGGRLRMTPREVRLRGLIDGHIDFVARVLRNAGTPEAEIDDEVQRTFIVATNRLDDMRPGCERGFLLRIALNLAAHARRTMARRREVGADQAPEIVDGGASAEQLTDRKRARAMLDRALDRMEGDLRTVFVLHEIEEMSMAEIATTLQIPPGTVASRLRRARADFREHISDLGGDVQRQGQA